MTKRRMTLVSKLVGLVLACVVAPSAGLAQVRVVNVVPFHLSGETAANPEPTIAVNPVNPSHMVIVVVAPGDEFCVPAQRAGLFITHDSGRTWMYACVIPRLPGDIEPFDVAFRFGPDGVLYGAHLSRIDSLTLRILDSTHPIGPAPMKIRFSQNQIDQPWIEVIGVRDTVEVVVSGNDKQLASVDSANGTGIFFLSRGARRTGLLFQSAHVDHRRLTGQNYAIRLAGHRDGTLYAIYYSPRGQQGQQLDVVVARDDSAARGGGVFDELRDLAADGQPTQGSRCEHRDGQVGYRLARCRAVPFETGSDSVFGQERRVGANLSIATDPRNSRTVYAAWADSVGTSHYTLHLSRSQNGGQRWSDDLLVVHNATNPTLAVDSTGTAGFAYQELTGAGDSTRWVTRLVLSDDGFATIRRFTLATVPAETPLAFMSPYIGDYMQLVALGTTFYGTFSAANTPNRDHFPNGVTFQRRADFTRRVLLDARGAPLQQGSIDPYFYSVGKAEHRACPSLRSTVATRPQSAAAARARARMNDIGCRVRAAP